MDKQEKRKCSLPADPCRQCTGQRRNNYDEVIGPTAKKVPLQQRERLRWQQFYRYKSELFSEHLNLVVSQLAVAEILPSV